MPERAGYTLVVGDDGPDRAAIEHTLLQAGMAVASATEAEALAVFDMTPPRLVVLDDPGGRSERQERLGRLSAHPPLAGVPIMVLAPDGDVESYTSAIRVAAAYFVKPVEPDELIGAARRLTGWTGFTSDTEKRRRVRRPLLMKVDLRIRSQRRDVPGQMLDASGGGCRVEVGEPVAPGELVKVILHTRDESTHVALGAEVRWHVSSGDDVHLHGLRFTGTTAMMAGALLGFVADSA